MLKTPLKGHEETDANTRWIMWLAIAAILCGIIMFLWLGGSFYFLKSFSERKNMNVAPANILAGRKEPPLPHLEVNPGPINKAHLAKENQLLESYGWLDRDKGIVRIPIKTAFEIMLYEH
jgi:hypothetical protein